MALLRSGVVLMVDIYANAAQYQALGWSLLPIRAGTKRPALKSVARVKRAPADAATVKDWFYGRDDLGVAVWLGRVSGGLVCRDFDDPTSYLKWRHAFPDLAGELPTVGTPRGRHVYCRADCDQIHDFGDGELQGNGYCLLPESTHPGGTRYWWANPPSSVIPRFNLGEIGFFQNWLHATERTEITEAISYSSSPLLGVPNSLPVSISEKKTPFIGDATIDQAIVDSLPLAEGRRNKMVFELARALKAIPSLADAEVDDLRPYVKRWHEYALRVIGTKPFEETWIDFVVGWPRVKFPKGSEPIMALFEKVASSELPAVADRYESPGMKLLVGLCRELQRATGPQPFFLSCRTAGRLLNVNHATASRWLFLLEHDRVIACVQKGNRKERKASRFKYLMPLREYGA